MSNAESISYNAEITYSNEVELFVGFFQKCDQD